MKIHKLYRDQKWTIWEREYFFIKANSTNEALKLLNDINSYIEPDETELLFDTMDVVSLSENDDNATIEIRDEDDELIYSNGDE